MDIDNAPINLKELRDSMGAVKRQGERLSDLDHELIRLGNQLDAVGKSIQTLWLNIILIAVSLLVTLLVVIR